MKYILLYLKTSGLKNLEHEVELQFYNKRIDNLSFDKSIIKAIYGTNGEGKTAIAYSLELYKNSIINSDYLAAQSFAGSLKQLINQHTNRVDLDIYFAIVSQNGFKRIFHHVIEYQLKDERIFVSHEKISDCKDNVWGNTNNETTLLETKDGVIVDFYKKAKFKDETINKTMNLLTNSSAVFPIVVNTIELFNKSDADINVEERAHFAFTTVLSFALSLKIFIDKEEHQFVSLERLKSAMSASNKEFTSIDFFPSFLSGISDSEDEVDEVAYPMYKNEIRKIEKLLKVFKPELDRIDINKSNSRGRKLVCRKTLVYKNGDKVDLEYESTGIKKLVRLFESLNSVDDGGVVFVDEFDANIHDVYLCKLIEYFSDYTNGQFIFTTHNLGPMEVLDKKDLKHSIDFINKQSVSSWKKNGNYSVVKVYRNGMIPNSPFNISSVDFVKVFGGRKKNG